MANIRFILNNQSVSTDLPSGSLALDFIRQTSKLSGTKIGCREGDCGACTVLVGTQNRDSIEYRVMTSCLLPLGRIHGSHVVTIEGINGEHLTPVQKAMVDQSASQCGFCTPGFVMSMTGYALEENKDQLSGLSAIDGNICRCTGYKSIERALLAVKDKLDACPNDSTRFDWLIEHRFIPDYFRDMPARLRALEKTDFDTEATLIMGGATDLNVQRPEEMMDTSIRFPAKPDGSDFTLEDGYLYVHAGMTAEQLKRSQVIGKYFPRLRDYMNLIASTPIRHMATLAGNFANASPIGDMTIMFLALGAEIELKQQNKSRWIALKDLFLSYKTLAKEPLEEIHRIRFREPTSEHKFHFEKVSKRTYLDIATVNSALYMQLEGTHIVACRVAAGGVAAIPLVLEKTSEFLTDKQLTTEVVINAATWAMAEVTPISDVRGSAEYKRQLVYQLVLAHFAELVPQEIDLGALV